MEQENISTVVEAVEGEGFDYAMIHYSSWEDVQDESFQKLYKVFKEGRKNLINYLRANGLNDVGL